MKIESVEISKLKPLEKNVRHHIPTQITELQRSYEQFGQTRPLVIDDDNNILIGNGFYEAVKGTGADKIDVYRMSGLTEVQKKKLILSDNRTFSIGLDDFPNIEEYINDICGTGDFEIAGYDESTLEGMVRTLDEVTADIQKQGSISPEFVQQLNEAHERNEQAMANTVTEAPSFSASNPSAPSQPVAQEVPQSVAKPNVEKTIICPNCGEVIHLA